MRTTVEENRAIGAFIATKLNAMRGPVRFLIPEGGVSAIDKPGAAFHDPEADRALFDAITQGFRAVGDKKLRAPAAPHQRRSLRRRTRGRLARAGAKTTAARRA